MWLEINVERLFHFKFWSKVPPCTLSIGLTFWTCLGEEAPPPLLEINQAGHSVVRHESSYLAVDEWRVAGVAFVFV
jgi:hypothetical protein